MTAAPLYPVSLRVEGRACLVVGGGRVATRKVVGLLHCGAMVTVVAPDVSGAIDELAANPSTAGPGSLTIHRRPYRPPEAANYWLAFAATGDPAVDAAVAEDAGSAGVWVNSADDFEHCSFLLPSVHRQGPIVLAVSTSGRSPALARWLRRHLAAAVGPEAVTLTALLEEARSELRHRGQPTDALDWEAILDGPLRDLVCAGQIVEARALLASALDSGLPDHHDDGNERDRNHQP